MSEVIKEIEPRLQYVLNDERFILDSSELNTVGINDIIYTDENESIILNGERIQEENIPTYIISDDGSPYITNHDSEGEVLIGNIDNTTQDTQYIIQYIDEYGNIKNPSNVIYVNEDGAPLTIEDLYSQYQTTELMEINENVEQSEVDSLINLECLDNNSYVISSDEEDINSSRIINLQCVTGEQEDNSFVAISPADWYQHMESRDAHTEDRRQIVTIPISNNNENTNQPCTITGKDLITGQTVTLESYMDKIKERIKSNPKPVNEKIRLKHNLNAFLNKKFNLGVTIGGKNLMGKIIHVSSKEVSNKSTETWEIDDSIQDTSENEEQSNDFSNKSQNSSKKSIDTKLRCVQTKLLSKKSDQFQRISSILSGLMKTDKIQQQLSNKSIDINLVDKYCYSMRNIIENVSVISGYMEEKIVSSNKKGSEWIFVPDTLGNQKTNTNNNEKQSQIKYPNKIGVTIETTHNREKSYVKVLINGDFTVDKFQCQHCGRLFKNCDDMKLHINTEHIKCEICDMTFQNREALLRHQRLHSKTTKEGNCDSDYSWKYLTNDSTYPQHLLVDKRNCDNEFRFSSCDICDSIFNDETELSNHRKSHSNYVDSAVKKSQMKYYACEICKRTFSRMANLQRHVAIHKNGEQLFRCAVCRCSFQYISTLTRHILKNHVQLQRPNFV